MPADLVSGPVEGGDPPGHPEQAQREFVALSLVAAEGAGTPGGDRAS
jgi:hypothetical protein